ncbi:hypothetical protein KC345_g122 [Hortaea werneckii]|nr:hypothetical protein KC345_g122 [Hortaea werneckii]
MPVSPWPIARHGRRDEWFDASCVHLGLEFGTSAEGVAPIAPDDEAVFRPAPSDGVSSIGSSMLLMARLRLSPLSLATMFRPLSIWKRPIGRGLIKQNVKCKIGDEVSHCRHALDSDVFKAWELIVIDICISEVMLFAIIGSTCTRLFTRSVLPSSALRARRSGESAPNR